MRQIPTGTEMRHSVRSNAPEAGSPPGVCDGIYAREPIGTGGFGHPIQDEAAAATLRAAVGANTARQSKAALDAVATQQAFAKNMTQLESYDTGFDGSICGPTALAGILVLSAHPEYIATMASKILDYTTMDERKESSRRFGCDMNDPTVKDIATKVCSPAQVVGFFRSLAVGAIGRENLANNGATAGQMMRLLTAVRQLGGSLPTFELHLFKSTTDPTGGGHWQGYSTDTGMEFNPWPDSTGHAVLTRGPAGLVEGGRHFENGACGGKMFVTGGGKYIQYDIWIAQDASNQPLVATAAPLRSLFYSVNTFNYGYTRYKMTGTAALGDGWTPADTITAR